MIGHVLRVLAVLGILSAGLFLCLVVVYLVDMIKTRKRQGKENE